MTSVDSSGAEIPATPAGGAGHHVVPTGDGGERQRRLVGGAPPSHPFERSLHVACGDGLAVTVDDDISENERPGRPIGVDEPPVGECSNRVSRPIQLRESLVEEVGDDPVRDRRRRRVRRIHGRARGDGETNRHRLDGHVLRRRRHLPCGTFVECGPLPRARTGEEQAREEREPTAAHWSPSAGVGPASEDP